MLGEENTARGVEWRQKHAMFVETPMTEKHHRFTGEEGAFSINGIQKVDYPHG